jgi:outer membrane receptor protein involved in Fe transport
MKPHPRLRSLALILATLAMVPAVCRIQAQGTAGDPVSRGALAGGAAARGKADAAIKLEAFTVTGTNITRLELEKVLPVTVLGREPIEARNALTPVELLTALPQVTTVPLNEASSGGANARGDNASLNFRGIGAGSTLVLLNGRRVAPHPMTSPDAGQLSFFPNVNQLPLQGLERIDFLRDGASSIYGSDAVAGVINFVTRRDFRGTELRTRVGMPEHGAGRSYQGTLTHGRDFGAGKGRWLTTLDFIRREPISYADRPRTRNPDHTALAPPPFNVWGSAFDDRSAIGVYPSFRVGTGAATQWFRPVDGVPALTSVSPARAANPEFYFNLTRYQDVGQSKTQRVNWFNNLEVDVTERITAFADLSFYHAKTRLLRQPINLNAPTSDRLATLSIDNPFNPYGSRFHSPTGSPNPDGTPRLTGTPQSVALLSLALVENGAEDVDVRSGVYRAVAGLRGRVFDQWTWETGALYTRAYSSDVSNHAVRESLFHQALQRGDATAFNPFGYTFRVAGNTVVADQPYSNPPAVLETFVRPWRRDGFSAITSVDLRAAGPLFHWGNRTVSVAAGIEFRREQFDDRRAPFAGLNPPGSGLNPDENDFILASPKPDSSGDREVYGAYVEAVAPLVTPERGVPGARSLELTASARQEHYSDFGTTTRPKFGVNWRPGGALMIRASYNRGFAAPNLPTLYAPSQYTLDGQPGRVDPYRSQTVGTGPYVMRNYTSGNPDLRPVTSTGKSAGIVVDVPRVSGLSFTVDYWKIEQQDLVGSRTDAQILDSDNAMLRAYTAAQLAAGRPISQIDPGSGTANYKGEPAVVRNAPTAQDIAAFNAYNASRPPAEQAAVVGTIFSRSSPYENISRSFVSGIDFSVGYLLPAYSWGRLSFNTEWCYLIESRQTRAPVGGVPTTSERLEVDGVTRWRGMGTLTWRRDNWTVSLGGYYIGDYADSVAATTGAVYESLGQPRYISRQFTDGHHVHRYRVRDVLSGNVSFGYRFGHRAPRSLRETSIRLGIVNLTDREPPLTPDTAGYAPAIHASLFPGRTWTIELTRQF